MKFKSCAVGLLPLSMLLLNSCSSIQYKRGLLIKNGLNCAKEDVYGNSDILPVYKPRIKVRLGLLPVTHTLAVGPFILIPLPVIPWLPGIVGAMSHPAMKNNDAPFQVVVTFGAYPYAGEPKSYRFSPGHVQLTAGDQTMNPTKIEYKSFTYDKGRYDVAHRHETKGCISEDDYHELVLTADQHPDCIDAEVTLTFNVTYSSVQHAYLELGAITTNDHVDAVPRIEIKDHAFALTGGPVIND